MTIIYSTSSINHILLNREHNNLLHVSHGQHITNLQRKNFPKWFKEQVRHLEFVVQIMISIHDLNLPDITNFLTVVLF